MKSTNAYDYGINNIAEISAAGKEYRWKDDGTDGLRSYSYNQSDLNWNYAEIDGTDSNGYYLFTDSSTGKPSARRGNLYNWTAATLGSSLPLKTGTQQAADSICPHGWQLPIDGTTDKSWGKLFMTYSITDDATSANHLREPPLEYLPTGTYDYVGGFILDRNGYGYWWTDKTYDDYSSLGLWVRDDGESHSHENEPRGYGYALRCVAPLP